MDKLYHQTANNLDIKSHLSSFNNPILTKAELKNKKLVRTLNIKMFKGFNQIKNSKDFKPITESYDWPIIQWQKPMPMPFNEMYNLNYKHKYFGSKKITNLNQVFNIKNMNNSINKTRNNVFLTSNNKTTYSYSISPSLNKTKNHENNNTNAFLLKRLFPNENELNKVSSLYFLSLEKQPRDKNTLSPALSQSELIKKNKFNEIEFLYKISHPLKASPKTQSNFYSKQNRNHISQEGNDNNNDKENMKLNITGMSQNKINILTSEEKRLNYIHSNLDEIRSLPKETFKDYIDNLFDDINTNEDNNKQSNIKEIQFNPDEDRQKEKRRYQFIKKQPQLIKLKVFQNNLNRRGEKYNELRKMAFEFDLKDNNSKNNVMSKRKNNNNN